MGIALVCEVFHLLYATWQAGLRVDTRTDGNGTGSVPVPTGTMFFIPILFQNFPEFLQSGNSDSISGLICPDLVWAQTCFFMHFGLENGLLVSYYTS